MAQQLVPQGTLNRLLASITPADTTLLALKVTSPFLGTDAIRLSFDDTATDLLATMTGMVTSPRPYQGVTLTIALVKTTSVTAAFMARFLSNTYVGQLAVVPDASNLGTIALYNMTLETIREISMNGTEPVVVVTMRGYRYVNSNAFDTNTALSIQSFQA